MTTTASLDLNDLPVGTPVVITGKGVWMEGTPCTIAKSYTIRFGHRMYDLKDTWGNPHTYYAPSQLSLA